MLRVLREMIARLGLVGAVALGLAFAAPAFAAEVCLDADCVASSRTAVDAPPADGEPCPDCGPACANGCCHAQHAATAADLSAPASAVPLMRRVELWLHDAAPPLARPAGPERPPRA